MATSVSRIDVEEKPTASLRRQPIFLGRFKFPPFERLQHVPFGDRIDWLYYAEIDRTAFRCNGEFNLPV